ncbi:unnamed protein product [Calicophoron daubneyi]|uniref:EGF-like domain-containing protein n=1 Tax=Calicophoron daubneyi TaxID=300641 RepID=A0AAV2T607_CALDB
MMLYPIILLTCTLAISQGGTRISVYYPRTWLASRHRFKFPPYFTRLDMAVFADWTSSTPTLKAWDYVKTANYEVPRYVREGFWMPDAMKYLCVPEAKRKSFADFIDAFTFEDYEKDPQNSIRQQFTLSGKYYDKGYFTLLEFLLNICKCLRKESPDKHCPNPCWKPNVCKDDPDSTGVCRVVRNPQQRQNIHYRLRSKLGDVYDFDYHCECKENYLFNSTTKKCLPKPPECDHTKCNNGGICEPVPEHKRNRMTYNFICHCPPAWSGIMCEEPRDPCKEAYHLCGAHLCYRDPRNTVKGYACACPPGTRGESLSSPGCVNVNECKELTDPCLNGGVCVDRRPSENTVPDKAGQAFGYACICKYGYAGERCERPPPKLYWSGWSMWSKCSASCGVGFHVRYRKCPLVGRCVGSATQTGRCLGPVAFCADSAGDQPVDEPSFGSRIVNGWGIGWTESEDRVLNDAFYWSETEDGWPNLYYKRRGFDFGDILYWTQLTELSRTWSLRQIAIFFGFLLAMCCIPLFYIVVSIVKKIKAWIRMLRTHGTEDENNAATRM